MWCRLTSHIAVMLLVFSAISVQSKENVNDNIIAHLAYLSSDELTGRKPDTEGSELAQQYIVEQFKKFNISPIYTDFRRRFTFKSGFSEKVATNLAAVVKGTLWPDKYWVITAHYDHLGQRGRNIYNGADDNASGVAAMLGLAEQLHYSPPKYSIILLATDAEELDLKGVEAFFNDLPVAESQIILNVNIDMIATRNRNKTLFIAGTKKNSHLKYLLEPLLTQFHNQHFRLRLGHDGISNQHDTLQKINWNHASDHWAFSKRGIPYLFFSVDTHKNYHLPTDTFDKINQDFYLQGNEAIWAIVSELQKLPPQQIKPMT